MLKLSFRAPRALCAGVFFLFAILLAVVGIAGGPASGWSIVASPNLTYDFLNYSNTYIKDLTCVSDTECWSVGYSNPYGQGSNQVFIERWNGSSWSVVDAPALNSYSASLNSVTCASDTGCWAVGSYLDPNTSSDQTLVEHWDGVKWSIVGSANTSATENNVLFGVACLSGFDCWAVGLHNFGTLTEHWDGNSWSVIASPNAGNLSSNILEAVNCVSGSDCWAAGYYLDNTSFPVGEKTLLEHWDGTTWMIANSPNGDPSQSTDSYLNGITCTSSSDCWSIGHSEDNLHGGHGSLVEHWDGNSWALVSSPSIPGPTLERVTCASAADCWIVGQAAGHTVTEHWDGDEWSVIASPDGDANEFNSFYGITCLTGSSCWAAGEYHDQAHSVEQGLVEHWDGTAWAIVPSGNPNTPGSSPESNQLFRVACSSEDECWAVGSVDSVSHIPLLQHWDGKSWTIASSFPTVSSLDQFKDISCTGPNDCWIVGSSPTASANVLMVHWDGGTWNVVPTPNANIPAGMSTIRCLSSSQCWAVGSAASGGYSVGAIEHWDGVAWKITPSPGLPHTISNFLYGVSCASAADCWAVGSFKDTFGGDHCLTEHWNGSSWSQVVSPNPGSGVLYSVACTSASNCWAVGSQSNGLLLFEHWDGGGWSVVPPTSSSSLAQGLAQITCTSSTNCWALGTQSVINTSYYPLMMNWDGISWAAIPLPNAGAGAGVLSGIACPSDTQCWGVGSYAGPNNTPQTLIEQYVRPALPAYTIAVNPSNSSYGVADGGGRYVSGSDVTVTATAHSPGQFHSWKENGFVVSTSPVYAFSAVADRNLVADFSTPLGAPIISPNGGTFKKKVTVKISSAGSATIYYTTDGTDPTTSSPVYPAATGKKKSKGITITGKGTHTLKAICSRPGFDASPIAVANFTIN